MKILHTADWHLGKKLDNFPRIEEQVKVLDEIIQIANEQHVDIVIIAGDLFDNFNPAVEAIELLYKTLKKLSNDGNRPVIAIAGNHDSPDRINAPDILAQECGIILIGYPNAILPKLNLENKFQITESVAGFFQIQLPKYPFPLRIIHTAYANELRLKEFFDIDDKTQNLQQSLSQQWHKLANTYCDKNGVNILVSHLYMVDKNGPELEEPEGERPLKIGTADIIYSDIIPPEIQYTALGHLHRHHQLGSELHPVIYSGSPIAYSFAEANQKKYVILASLQPEAPPVINKVILEKGKPLIRKSFNNISDTLIWLASHQNALVEITYVSDTFLSASELSQIRKAHAGVIHIIPQTSMDFNQKTELNKIDLNNDIRSLFIDYFKTKNGMQLPNEELLTIFNEILNEE